ncbi:excinuclease ABC subunit UvrC [Streptomyces sp. NBC_01221]|uniref:excinuclease ABC subunit UvrC n=1 Tax=unclassified Streptomyces TaxID=2593676 RepID=UPI00224E3671|nr:MULTISPECIES: excinuclease ABC subunit UvrC [unclassified Streptomyces]WSP54459.1 excinuclease ABC subunit UvrC [Streptomyces sp. NBC_01241]WSU24866.1 excinuclease ABC subunit UvrC [Streptomyces sp. NBC_01108]MCX4785992.1 excinuclease ABC subunit UvrC [Streptomyces sp. NBC_01221]MCX4798151.1 excinuclease ABC subunit UvrC [Streptomyces sp. NBC_01242]WSJ39400.1 excinuclease ABC subunit UvrC [Streptomyces sp. NBC_01321]
MADPSSYRPKPGQIPDSPGVYKFRDEHRRVIYVGKAKNLRQRLANYFQDLAALHPRTRTMVTTAASVEWTVVSTEVEALQLEYSWIKEFDPRFNVKYRDDKSYPYLAVTLNEEFPRVQVMRGAKKKGVRYFGPYGHAWAIRETVDLMLRVFPVRTCSAGVFKNAARTGRPCLLGYIGKCSAPCVGRVTPEEHRELAVDFCDFMAGRTGTYIRRLEKDMMAAAEEMEYERAARLRDDVEALKRAMEKSAVVLADATDADLIAVAEDDLEAAVQIFHVRGGRVRGQRGWVTDKVENVDTSGLVEHALQQLYGEETGDSVPKEVLVPALPEHPDAVSQWLADRRGSQVSLRIPQRGDKKDLMTTVQRNAQQALGLHKTKRASDLTTRSRALEEIAEALGLDTAPLRIECFDISHLQGDDVVASMVVFEDGLARKSEYRRFQIKGFEGQDDVRSMHEVIGRRFKRYLQEKERTGEWEETPAPSGPVPAPHTASTAPAVPAADPDTTPDPVGPTPDPVDTTPDPVGTTPGPVGTTPGPVDTTPDPDAEPREDDGRPKRFAYPPQLVVVDGGQPQVAAAKRALDELGIDDIAVCGLAKRLEEVWLPEDDDPVVLPRSSEGLYLLQRVRDEAHRFAITYQRAKRAKRIRSSPLDAVAGLGETRKQALIKHFGSVKKLKQATIDEICEAPGIGRRTAESVAIALASAAPATPAVNTATGEIIEEDDGGSTT